MFVEDGERESACVCVKKVCECVKVCVYVRLKFERLKNTFGFQHERRF